MSIESLKNKKYKVITICGPKQFKDEIEDMVRSFTLMGKLVLVGPLFGNYTQDDVHQWEDDGTMAVLNQLMVDKIDVSDALYIVNKDNIIDDMSKDFIALAKAKGIHIGYYE